jgi:hypothetical protein
MWFKLGTINNLKLLSYLTVRVFNVLKGTLVSFNIGKIFLKCSWNKIFLLVCHKISMIFQKEIIIFDMKERSEFGCVFVSVNMMICVGVLISKVRVRRQVRAVQSYSNQSSSPFPSKKQSIHRKTFNQLSLNENSYKLFMKSNHSLFKERYKSNHFSHKDIIL